jgi:tRNA pseudouridine55 synthase
VTAGFLLVDKPGGMTSHDVVVAARRALGIRKIGHAGTLDPMATGLLVLGVGRATRLLRFVQGAPKTYLARVVFGVATDTLDAEGSVVDRAPMPVTEEDLEGVVARFLGPILQVPPMVSAVKMAGRRLYELAREGIEVERAARTVEIHEIDVLDFAPSDYPEAVIRVRCSTGTYVRTLADDIARALGGRAHLGELRRLAIGGLHVSQGVAIDRIGVDVVVDPSTGLRDLPVLRADAEAVAAIRHGVPLPARRLGTAPDASGPHRVLDDDGELVAVYSVEGRRTVPEVVWS